ncbi:MAG: late competence development ComFB family protein [Spirochaetes bacterium]|nr:late competence development ComFB family protein [Spirochaetota bacterium]
MKFFNLVEMIVENTVNEVLTKEKNSKNIKFHRSDIIAYVLNRVPPRYVTGERGIIHTRIDPMLKYQEQTDILFLTYEAIKVFSERRSTDTEATKIEMENLSGLMPYLMGEVLEETTLSMIPDIEVTLLYNNKNAEMMDMSWKNPYIATTATKGYYHFWPKYIESEMGKRNHIEFTLKFSHEKIVPHSIQIITKINKKGDLEKIQSIPLVLLKLKEGVSADFLVS